MPQTILDYLDASADLTSPHYPRLEKGGDPWFPYTQAHFMTSLKLTPCARLLWDWILLKAPAGAWIEVDLHDFRAVTAEHRRGKPYSLRQIRKAVNELEELQLVAIRSERVRMQARHPGPVVNQKQKSERSEINFQSRNLTSTPRNLTSTPRNLTSTSKLETLATPEPPSPSDLDQILSDLSPPPPPLKPEEREKEAAEKKGSECEAEGTYVPSTCLEKEVQILTQVKNPEKDQFSGAGREDLLKPLEKKQDTPIKQDWEVEPGKPYPAFIEWHAKTFYEPQGGRWAARANSNAASEIRNNPERAVDLWQEFLRYCDRATDSALIRKDAGMDASLPSCLKLEATAPVSKEQVAAKLEALASEKALPPAPASPATQAPAAPINNAPQTSQVESVQAYTLYQPEQEEEDSWEQRQANLRRLRDLCRGVAAQKTAATEEADIGDDEW